MIYFTLDDDERIHVLVEKTFKTMCGLDASRYPVMAKTPTDCRECLHQLSYGQLAQVMREKLALTKKPEA